MSACAGSQGGVFQGESWSLVLSSAAVLGLLNLQGVSGRFIYLQGYVYSELTSVESAETWGNIPQGCRLLHRMPLRKP